MSHPPWRLIVLQSSSVDCEYQDDDSPADVEQHLKRAGFLHDSVASVENIVLTPENYTRELVTLQRRFADKGEFDCIINLCDGAWDEPSCGIQVVQLLENQLDLPFTGADVNFFEPTRLQMKRAVLAAGVSVPLWRFVYSHEDIQGLVAEFADKDKPLKFPLLVKHFSSYSSIGLTKESKVFDVQALKLQCERMVNTYGGALVEEFITGREFTVLAAQVIDQNTNNVEVAAYPPVECRFGPNEDFKHYNLKWVDYDDISWHPVSDQDLSNRLKDMAVRAFASMGGRGYGRIDVRSDDSGQELYFLEVNPNCGLFYPQGLYGSADFILDQVDKVRGHADFIISQVKVARRLWQRSREDRILEPRYVKGSWGMYAMRDIAEGQVLQFNEQANLRVVTKAHVLEFWEGTTPGRKKQDHKDKSAATNGDTIINSVDGADALFNNWDNFRAYCWPLSDTLFAMWHADPDHWQPLNHSCDPNAWNAPGNGLDVVARRHIRAGEQVTMDYATFCGHFPEMQAFDCHCQSPLCRGTITGIDIHRVELARRYRGHMSDYVARKALEIHGVAILEQPVSPS